MTVPRVAAFVFALVIAGLTSSGSAIAAGRTVRITFALVSDLYEMEERAGRGGFARIAAAIKAERASGRRVVVAHAGDTISPSLYSGFDQGAHIIELTNLLAPDLFVPGNHEYDFGEGVFRARMAQARFPLLAANLRDGDGNPLPGITSTTMIEHEGVRIGVIGLTADDSPERSSPGALRFLPTVQTARDLAAELRAAGADLVVALAHADRRTDLRLFYGHDIDLLLSGDDHDLAVLYDGRSALVEAMSDGAVLAAVDLEITLEENGANRSLSWWPRFRIVDTADVTPDPVVAERVAELKAELSKDLDVALGITTTALDSRKSEVRAGETAIGNLFADAMREAAGAEVAVLNGGGIRGDRTYPAGTTLKRRDVLGELPFSNKLVKVELSGDQLLQALENGLWFAGKPNGRFLQVSGLAIVAKADAVPGHRIVSVLIGGQPLEPTRSYQVATNDFIAAGKEGFAVFETAERLISETSGQLVSNAVMDYIRKLGQVAPAVEGRIRIE